MLSLGKVTHKRGEDRRRFSPTQHRVSCGIDLHARTLYVCIVRHDGARLVPCQMPAAPAPFLTAATPYREGLVVALAGLCTWYGLADRCAAHALPCLGHALSMPALQGGMAQNAQSDSPKHAALLRGGMLPQASGSPAARRSTRALWRRRTPLRRNRAALLTQVHKTNAPYNVPDLGTTLASQATRAGVAERLNDPAVPQTIEVDLARMPYDDALLRDGELARVPTAKPHEAHTLAWLQTVPGSGNLLCLVLRDAIPAIGRLPRVQDCASYARLVQGRQASAGKRWGTSGKTSGHAHLQGAWSAAAPGGRRHHPHGPQLLPR
jgi:hypothetical protein